MTPAPRSTVLPGFYGFAFVFVAFEQTLWIALLCLLGAVVAHTAAMLVRGETSFGELQERMEGARSGFSRPDGAPRVR